MAARRAARARAVELGRRALDRELDLLAGFEREVANRARKRARDRGQGKRAHPDRSLLHLVERSAGGDEVLRETARRISSASRGSDVIGRYGGEEFVVLLPEASRRDAVTAGDKLRGVLSKRPIAFEGYEIAITTSVGVSTWTESATAQSLLAAADEALYSAKHLRRNRTEISAPVADPVSSPLAAHRHRPSGALPNRVALLALVDDRVHPDRRDETRVTRG